MKIYMFVILLVSFCVFTEALRSFDMIRKLKRINKILERKIYEKENQKGKLIMKDKGNFIEIYLSQINYYINRKALQ